MSDNTPPTLWWVDTENVTVTAVAYPTADRDAADHRTRRNATHFDSERGAWDALGAQVTARVSETGRGILNAEEALRTATGRQHTLAEATLWDWHCLAASAARNYALYHERRVEWNRQVP